MVKKCLMQEFVGNPAGNFFVAGTGQGPKTFAYSSLFMRQKFKGTFFLSIYGRFASVAALFMKLFSSPRNNWELVRPCFCGSTGYYSTEPRKRVSRSENMLFVSVHNFNFTGSHSK
jgi:hypothetical protein